MTEHLRSQESAGAPSGEPGVLELLKKIQQQLVYLERKIDALGGGAAPRPFHQGREFSRPPRSFDRPHYHGGPKHERHEPKPGMGPFPRPSFRDRPPREDRPHYAHGKKPFFKHRKGHA